MASNPRKFSEKIALHNQKQMEETAAFEKIMREVSHATSKPASSALPPSSSTGGRTLAPGPSLGVYRGGSLPNVSDQLLAAARQQHHHHHQQQTVLLPPTQLILQQKKFIVLTALPQQEDTTTTTTTCTMMTDSISNDELMAQFGLSEAGGGANSNHSSSGMLDNSFKGGGSNGSVSGNNSDSNNGQVGGAAGTVTANSPGAGAGGMVKSNSTNLSHSSSNLSAASNNSNSGQPSQSHHQSRVRNVGVGPMRRPADRKIDTSPYGNNVAYLSPPSDSSWRRTSSDSAIHQSLSQQQGSPYHSHHQYTSHSPLTLSPTAHRKGEQQQQHPSPQQQQMQAHHQQQQHAQYHQQQHQQQQQHQHQMGGMSLSHNNINAASQGGGNNMMLLSSTGGAGASLFHGHNVGHSQSNQQINFIVGGDGTGSSGGIGMIDNSNRPRSSCGRLPGINIHPSAHDNSIVQIPIGNNTGSLPDLTSVHFPSPLHTPIDQEHDHSSSPYSSSPITASPTTLSPTSMPVRHPGARFQYSPAGSPGDGGGSASFSPTHGQQNTSQQFLSVPGSHRYSHFNNKSVTMDTSYHQQQQQPPQGVQSTGYNNLIQSQYQQQQQQQPGTIHGSHGNLSNIPQANLSGYRSPQCRPSPGSSPNLIGALTNSSGDNSNPSAPCSPSPAQAAASPGNNGQSASGGSYGDQYTSSGGSSSSNQNNNTNNANDIYYLNQQNIQQHFESFSLVDNPDFITSQDAQAFAQFDDGSFTNFAASPAMTTMNQQSQQQQSQGGGGGTTGPAGGGGDNSSAGGGGGSSGGDDDSSIKSLLMNPMIGSQQNSTMSNGLDLGQQLQQQQQQQGQGQSSSLVAPSLQTPNTPTSIPEIIFTDFSSSAGSEFTKEIFDDTLMPLELELGQMDVAGFQMLANPNATMIADPTDEDTFRQDLH